MKTAIVSTLMLLFLNTATADDTDALQRCDDVKGNSPAQSALLILSSKGYLTLKEVQEHEKGAINRRRSKDLALETIGLKTVSRPIPFYEELVPQPPGNLPFDTPRPNDDLYQIVQHLRIKNLAGKVFEFVIIASITEHDCSISTPLIIETSPRYKVISNWEDYLQTWERLKRKEKDISPNLVK